MPSKFVVYDGSGRIVRTGSAPVGQHYLQAVYGSELVTTVGIADVFDSTQYVDLTDPANPVIAPRSQLALTPDKTTVAADGIDMVTIPSAPNPTDVMVTGPATFAGQSTDGTVVLTFAQVGIYTLTLSSFPYLDQEITINAI